MTTPCLRSGPDGPGRLKSWRQAMVLSLIAGHQEPVSAKSLAAMTGATISAAAHHVRGLARAGMLHRVEERHAGTVFESFYVVTDRGHRALRQPRAEALLVLTGAGPRTADERATLADIDERAWAQLAQLAESVRPQIAAVCDEATRRHAPTAP